MTDRYQLERRNGKWHVVTRKGAENVIDALGYSLGGCPSLTTALRLWLALQRGRGGK